MKIYVQFSDSEESSIAAVFCCPQDADLYPNQGQVEETDPRFSEYLEKMIPLNHQAEAPFVFF